MRGLREGVGGREGGPAPRPRPGEPRLGDPRGLGRHRVGGSDRVEDLRNLWPSAALRQSSDYSTCLRVLMVTRNTDPRE